MRRTYFSLAGGIALALIAVLVIRMYLGSGNRGPEIPLTVVAVASHDIASGTKLQSTDIQLIRWPEGSVPHGAFHSYEALFKTPDAPGDRVALIDMVAGEPVLPSKVSGFGTRPTMSARVSPGMRAFAIKIDAVSSVSGFILPGDHVDILLTRETSGGERSFVTSVIMQNVTVLGIDQMSDQKADKPVVGRTAAVEVSPEQTEKLALAEKAGSLSLALRNQQTAEVVSTAPVAERDLGGAPRIKRTTVSAPGVRVRYGGNSVVNHPVAQ